MSHRYLKYVTIVLTVLFLFACQTAQVNMRNPDGETTPKPFYRASATRGSQLTFTWYYVQYVGVKDKDGSVQLVPIYLDAKKKQTFNINHTQEVKMILRIFNPLKEHYKVYSTTRAIYRYTGDDVRKNRLAGESFLDYREWEFKLPVDMYTRKMVMSVEVLKDKSLALRTRKFTYEAIK